MSLSTKPAILLATAKANPNPDRLARRLSKIDHVVLCDVRSRPESREPARYQGQANLKQVMKKAGIGYLYLGDNLGERPSDTHCWNNGALNMRAYARTETWKTGLNRLCDGLTKGFRIVLLGTDADFLAGPLTRSLKQRGVHTRPLPKKTT